MLWSACLLCRDGPIFGPVIGTGLEERTDRDLAPGAAQNSDSVGIGAPLLPFIDGEPSGGRGGQVSLVDPSNGEPFACVAQPYELFRI